MKEDYRNVLTTEEKMLIKTVKEMAPKGGKIPMKTVTKLLGQNCGLKNFKKRQVSTLLDSINAKILENLKCGFTKNRAHDDEILNVTPNTLAQAHKLY